jgi:outer membrane protein OmpA-like peptidoglycan-associated protein
VIVKLRLALLTATGLALPLFAATHAHAQAVTGVYVAGGIGYNLEENQKLKDGVVGTTALSGTAKIATDNGYMGEGSVGYGFGDGFRVELEGDYYSNIFSKSVGANVYPSSSGRSTKYGVMVNALYDLDIPGWQYMFPYVGIGGGYQEADYNNFSTPGGLSADESKASFAGQAIVGFGIPIAPVPGLSLTAEYRFMALVSARKYHGTYQGIDSSFKAQDDLNNTFLLGVRYQLFTPPPPPPPAAPMPVAAPAPAPAKTYLVFFDWDKYNLTPRALDIIAQAASDSKTQSTTTIAVNGYTDTSGTPVYNQGLSVRRAKAVEAQLVTDGVPASEITAQGFGDTDLLVPTGPGVREPQNRRVQIVLQ